MTTVNIVTSDRGWILERLAQELVRRLPYVTFGEGPDPGAAIQYYITYSSRRRRISPIEVACFTHLEPEGEAHDRFFAVAREVEHCVCQSRLYEAVLREAGVAQITTIAPGVDLEAFQPKLRIGVVGRTYHTGRKGEHLVAQVMDIPEIEWSFTGEGWPGPALKLPPGAMPVYYRSLDYVLVPALYEGGPMCVVEALACGTEVIAPPVGWVPEFPHVEFPVGDADELRRVLLGLVERKRALRASVLGHSWESWAEGHDRLFRDLAARAGMSLAAPGPRPQRNPPRRVGLFLHGNETVAQGGPSVRVPRLAEELSANGTEAELRQHTDARGFERLDLAHVVNAWAPGSALDALRRARRAGLATAFSPILLDLSEREMWGKRLPSLLAEAAPGPATDAALAAFRAEIEAERTSGLPRIEPAPGFHAALREMAALSDQVVLLGEAERDRLAAIGLPAEDAMVVRNPVDAALFATADPALFTRETGLSDFVLCVARLEPRKNQAMLAHALRGTGLDLVLIGHAAEDGYRALVERHAGPGLRILDRLPANSPLLASAYAAARVVVLPSWAEGAPLAALEAAAAGASMVLSDRSGEREHFGDWARYCDPADPASIRDAVLAAFDDRRGPDAIADQKAFVAERFGWRQHREATERAYARAFAKARNRAPAPSSTPAPEAGRSPIVFDVTTTANHAGRWTGIARVEAALALALSTEPQADLRFVAWNDRVRRFVEIPAEALRDGSLRERLAQFDNAPAPPVSLPAGARLLVPGSAWMQNERYAQGVVAFAREHRLRLVPLIHDVIPTKFPFWFDEAYAPVFEANLAMLLGAAAHVIAVSESTRRDVEAFAARTEGLFLPPVSVLREGDEIRVLEEPGAEDASARMAATLGGRSFVLSVGAIHQRKNHRLLYDVWLKLVERMGARCPVLVLVGGVAWNAHDVARALRGDPRLKDRVLILDDVADGGLEWLYANCLFTLYPSLYEGWGLPVAESLRHGKMVLASDTSSVPEIAPGLVDLLDPLDVAQWAARVQFYAGSAAARAAAEARIAQEHRPFGWRESACALATLLSLPCEEPAPLPYLPGSFVDFADAVASSRIRGVGWDVSEPWGCWTRARVAELHFALSRPITEPMALLVQARAALAENEVAKVRVLANGQPIGRWTFRSGAMLVLHAMLPAGISGERMNITIENDALRPENAGALCQVGIGLAKAALVPLGTLRELNLCFGETVEMRERAEAGRTYRFLQDGVAHGMLVGSWSAQPAWGLVPNDADARLGVIVTDLPGHDLDLTLRLRPVAAPDARQRVVAMANGEQVAEWSFDSDAPTTVSLRVPAALRAVRDPLELELVPDTPRPPRDLGLGAGHEAFGVGLIGMQIQPAGVPHRVPRLMLQDGARLDFSGADAAALLGPDWHAMEPHGTWSFGAQAALPLRVPGAAAGTQLRLSLTAFRPAPGAADAGIEAWIGGVRVGRQDIQPGASCILEITLPEDSSGPGGELDLVLKADAAASPFVSLGAPDERPLGLRLAWIERATVPSLQAGAVISFRTIRDDRAADGSALLRQGWFATEETGTWSEAVAGRLLLSPAPDLPSGWRLFTLARIHGAPGTVDVELDGAKLDRWDFGNDGFALLELRDVASRLAAGAKGELRFLRHGAASPRELGHGEDGRLLGVMLLGMVAVGPLEDAARAADLFHAAGLGRFRAPSSPSQAARRSYDFSEEGDVSGLGLTGWFAAEAEGRWSRAEGAEIALPPPAGPRPERLRLELLGRVHGAAASGPVAVELRLGDGPSATLVFTDDGFARRALEFALDARHGAGPMRLLITRPHAISPAETGDGEDRRKLGIMIQTLGVVWS